MKILVLNGPNINFLGKREPDVYGSGDYEELCRIIRMDAVIHKVEVDIKQSNIEGEIVDILQQADGEYDGIVINPAAYTHYSVAILDAIKSINIPTVEVHISNIYKREEFRRKSITAEACVGIISGFGADGYVMAINALIDYLS